MGGLREVLSARFPSPLTQNAAPWSETQLLTEEWNAVAVDKAHPGQAECTVFLEAAKLLVE